MSGIIYRLLEFVNYKGLSKRAFYSITRFSNGYLDREKSIGSDKLEVINSNFPELNLMWLITGKGSMILGKDDIIIFEESPRGIPLYSSEASAGEGLHLRSDFIIGHISIPTATDGDVALTVVGDSMTPEIKGGDIAILREISNTSFISWGEKYVVVTKDYTWIKLVKRSEKEGYVILESTNPAYDPILLPHNEILKLYLVKNTVRRHCL